MAKKPAGTKVPAKQAAAPGASFMHLLDWIDFLARVKPQFPAIITPKARLNHAQLAGAVHSIGNRLLKAGVKRGSTAAIWIANPGLHAAVLIALNRLGVVCHSCLHLEASRVALPAGVKVDLVVADDDVSFSFCKKVVPVDLKWLDDWKKVERITAKGFSSEDDVCIIASSSGTTGTPKGIPLSLRQIQARIGSQTVGIASSWEQRVLCLLDISTVWGLVVYLSALWGGATVFSNFAKGTGRLVQDARITRIIGSPASIGDVVSQAETGKLDCSSVKEVMAGGAIISPALQKRIVTMLCRNLMIVYGSSELGYVTYGHPVKNIAGAVGFLVPWVEAEAVNARGEAIPAGKIGELRFRTDLMAEGYVDDSKSAAFRDGWFYPGDIGGVAPNGLLVISGRTDDVINAAGRKIHPSLIERAVTRLEQISDAAAFVSPQGKIWIAVEPQASADTKSLRELCRAPLKPFAVERLFVFKTLPRNAMGKVLRPQLRQMAVKMLENQKSPKMKSEKVD